MLQKSSIKLGHARKMSYNKGVNEKNSIFTPPYRHTFKSSVINKSVENIKSPPRNILPLIFRGITFTFRNLQKEYFFIN